MTFLLVIHWDAGTVTGTSTIVFPPGLPIVQEFGTNALMIQWVDFFLSRGITIPQRDTTLHIAANSITLIESKEIGGI